LDIKSKNIKYSFKMKLAAVILVWASFAALFGCAVLFGVYNNDISTDNYYESNNFGKEFIKCVENAIHSNEVQAFVANLTKEGKVSEPSGEAGKNTGKDTDDAVNFKYIVRNTNTNEFVSNLHLDANTVMQAVEDFKNNKSYLYFSVEGRKSAFNNLPYVIPQNYPENVEFFSYLSKVLNYEPVELYATVDDRPKPGDVFYDMLAEHNKVHSRFWIYVVAAVLAFAAGLCSFIYLVIITGRSEKNGIVKPAFIDSLYNDLHTALVALAAILSVSLANWVISSFGDDLSKGIGIFVLLSIDLLIGLNYILSMIRHIRRRTLFSYTLIYRMYKGTSRILIQCFSAKTFKPSMIVLLLVYGGMNAILFAIATHFRGGGFWFMIFLLLCLNAAAIYQVSKAYISLYGIMKWVKEMTKGNLESSPNNVNMSPVLIAFANDISSLQTGLKQAVAEAVRGERLKTELITNVSHDLKTPLTSIINYIDLLKQENLDNETVNEYIGVLVNKSAKLKQLVEDLLEASQAACGDIKVNFGSVDLCALAAQSVAEFSDKASEAELDIRIKACEKPVAIRGDGTLMWRIMDNLLSNVIKYSLKNSRVYIDIENTGTFGVITIKNISEAALDIPSDQLMERFVRGDVSRSTEGSGLGLSIAKSLSEIQRGTLELKIDGDLFKVIVSIPLALTTAN